jgi:carbamoyltransferase
VIREKECLSKFLTGVLPKNLDFRPSEVIDYLVSQLFRNSHTYKKGSLWGVSTWQSNIGTNKYIISISKDNIGTVVPNQLIGSKRFCINYNFYYLNVYKIESRLYLKNDSRIILGLTKEGHDASAALVDISTGNVLCFCQEERISRVKHERRFPSSSIHEVLKIANLKPDRIGAIAVGHALNWYNTSLPNSENYLEQFNSLPPNFAKSDFTKRNDVSNYIKKISRSLDIKVDNLPPIYFVRHHLAHAFTSLSAYPSNMKKNLVVVTADGRGEWETVTAWNFKNNQIKELFVKTMPNSLAYFYTSLGWFFGWRWYGFEGRLMGLAPYGKPKNSKEESIYKELYAIVNELLNYDEINLFSINTNLIRGGYSPNRVEKHIKNNWWINAYQLDGKFLDSLMKIVQPIGQNRKINPDKTQFRSLCLLAYVIQEIFNNHWISICKKAVKMVNGDKSLLLSGGVALNSSSNGNLYKLFKEDDIEIFIPPCPADDGLAIGAVAALSWALSEESPDVIIPTAQLGSYSEYNDILTHLEDYAFEPHKDYIVLHNEDHLIEKISSILANGESIAVFHGREEIGPRALGGRSILIPAHIGDPIKTANKAKRREQWRPVAVSVLVENVDKIFSGNVNSYYMNICTTGLKGLEHNSDYLHPGDRSCRPQVVDEKSPFLLKILKSLNKSNILAVVNTSFNINEPIVHTIPEALDTFYYLNGIQYLLINNIIIKNKNFKPSLISCGLDSNVATYYNDFMTNKNNFDFFFNALKIKKIENQESFSIVCFNNDVNYLLFKELYIESVRNVFFNMLRFKGLAIKQIRCDRHKELKNMLSTMIEKN